MERGWRSLKRRQIPLFDRMHVIEITPLMPDTMQEFVRKPRHKGSLFSRNSNAPRCS